VHLEGASPSDSDADCYTNAKKDTISWLKHLWGSIITLSRQPYWGGGGQLRLVNKNCGMVILVPTFLLHT
jgi:hypothetical protein